MRTALILILVTALAAADGQVTASLHLDHSAVAPGGNAMAILRLRPAPGWHIYWRNPGDSGLPTAVEWQLPPGVNVGDLRWPIPQRFADSGLVSFGYETELLLSATVTVAADAPAGATTIGAEVSWLACLQSCIPGDAELGAALVIADAPVIDPEGTALATRADAGLPASETPWRCTAQVDGERLVIDLHPLDVETELPVELAFYPETEGLVVLDAAQRWAPGPLPQLTIQRRVGAELPAELRGLLVAGDARAWSVAIPLAPAAQP